MSRNHTRSASASLDNRAFREAIANMRQENLESKAETQRVKDQLNCLVMLVRRAWMGDEVAAVHVSNIVGVAPPSIQQVGEEVQLTFKSKAVHHWAMLTIGLLNRHYRHLEEQSLALAKSRLQQRQDFLDDQLLHHREILSKTQRMKMSSFSQLDSKHAELVKSIERLGRQPVSYVRKNSSTLDELTTPQTMLEFLYPGKEFQPARTTSASNRTTSKYIKPGLFDIQGVVGEKPKPRRPLSAHQVLKKADSLHKATLQRIRPQSAVATAPVKGDRPLKYETTRPLSGKSHSSAKQRVKSASVHSNKELNADSAPHRNTDSKAEMTLLDDEKSIEILQDARGPRSMADSVAEELRKITLMEEEFRKTTKMLQQKLGITGDGTI